MTKVLVVDDDLMVLAIISMGLQQAGYQVFDANNGNEALRICRQEKPDCVLLDIRMPGMSGIVVAEEISPQNIPFIFMSVYSDMEMVKSAGETSALGYLIKPMEIPCVIDAIEDGLKRAKERTKTGAVNENLNKPPANNRDIEIAIGLFMERHQISTAVASECLRVYARSHRLKLIDVAKAIVSKNSNNTSLMKP